MADWDKVEVADNNLTTKRVVGDLAEPKTADETQETDSKNDVVILVNNKNYRIFDQAGNLEIRNKAQGFGIHISKTGDIMLLTGRPENGALGGRLCINAEKGQLLKAGGPIITEATADSKSPVEGEGSKTSEGSGKDGLARSDVHYGDWISETHGEIKIMGRNITIEAADVLSLVGGSIQLQAGAMGGGEINMIAGSVTEKTSMKETAVSSSNVKVGAGEDTDLQYDPRASRNIISSGHMNINALGDYRVSSKGVASMAFGGNPAPIGGVPLIEKRTTGLAIETILGNATLKTSSPKSNIQISAGGFGFPDAGLLKAGSVTVSASTLGDVKIKGKFIHLN